MAEPSGLSDFLNKVFESTALWGFLGALVGGGVSVLTTWINTVHGSRLEDRRSRELRVESARQFQRATLLSIQDELFESTKAISQVAAHVASREENGYKRREDEIAAIQDLNKLSAKIGILNERVADEALRMKLLEFLVAISKFCFASTKEEINQLFHGHAERFAGVQTMLGRVLRSHFEPINSPPKKPWWRFWGG